MQSPVIHHKSQIWWPDIEFLKKSPLTVVCGSCVYSTRNPKMCIHKSIWQSSYHHIQLYQCATFHLEKPLMQIKIMEIKPLFGANFEASIVKVLNPWFSLLVVRDK